MVVLGQLASSKRLPLLRLDSTHLQTLCLISPLSQLPSELVIVLCQKGVLLEETVDLGLQLVSLAQLYLQESDLIQQTPVLSLAPKSSFERDLLLDNVTLDPSWGTTRV